MKFVDDLEHVDRASKGEEEFRFFAVCVELQLYCLQKPLIVREEQTMWDELVHFSADGLNVCAQSAISHMQHDVDKEEKSKSNILPSERGALGAQLLMHICNSDVC